MRLITFLLLSGFSVSALAGKPLPPDLQPLPEPPPLSASDSIDEPEVTITKQTEQTIEEYRSGNKLYMIKITPKVGLPYYLIDNRGDGQFIRQGSIDPGFRPPQWVIKKF